MKKLFTLAAAALSASFIGFAGNTLQPVSINPAEESYIAEGTDITLDYGVDLFQNWDAAENVTIVNMDDPSQVFEPMVMIGWPEAQGMVITFNLDGQGQQNGCYILNVPAKLATNAEGEGNAALQLYYYYDGNAGGGDVAAPAMLWATTNDGTELNNPVWIGMNCEVAIDFLGNPTFTDGEETYSPEVEVMNFGSDSMVSFRVDELPDPIVKAGTYTLTVPAGYLLNINGLGNEEIVLSWDVDGSKDNGETNPDEPVLPAGEPTIEPVSAYPSNLDPFVIPDDGPAFDEVILTLETPVTIDVAKEITISSARGRGPVIACTATYDALMEEYFGPRVRISFAEPITITGNYMLVIPEAAFVDADGNYNPALMLDYEVQNNQGQGGSIADLEIVNAIPAVGSTLSGFMEGDAITVYVNTPDVVSHVGWSLFNMTDTSVDGGFIYYFSPDFCALNEDGAFVFTNGAIDFPFYEGNTYQFRFNFFDETGASKMLTVDYVGTSQNDYKISDVKIESINPVPGMDSFITAETNFIVVKFTGSVDFVPACSYATEGGQMASRGAVTAKANDAERTEWTVFVDKAYVEANFGGFSFVLGFADDFGYYVIPTAEQIAANSAIGLQYNPETEKLDLIDLRYNCLEGGVTVDVAPAAGEVESLSAFTLTNPNSQSSYALNWGNVNLYPVVLLDEQGAEVAAGADYAAALVPSEEVSDELNTEITVTLDTVITTPGKYTLVIPWQSIVLGSEFSAQGYKGQTVSYTVKENSSILSLEAENARADVYNLQGICVKRAATAADLRSLAPGVYVIFGKKYLVR